MNWDDLRFFLAVARTGNLTEAARLLLVRPSTVARRIDDLERAVGRPLFVRRQSGYRPSEAGASLLATAEAVEAKALTFERAAGSSDRELDGLVRVATPELLGNEFLLPRLAPFLGGVPGLRVDFLADVRPVRLAHQEADVLLRLTRPEQGAYKLRRVGALALGLFGSPAYLAKHPEPRTWADLSAHALIGWVEDLQFLTHARWVRQNVGDTAMRLRTNGMAAQLRAAGAGLGLAVLPHVVASEAGLQRVLRGEPMLRLDLWLATAEEFAATPRVQAVADAIAAVLDDSRASLDPSE
ncbi:LysR family transcriptional regulator [Azospirillum doebereinerae]